MFLEICFEKDLYVDGHYFYLLSFPEVIVQVPCLYKLASAGFPPPSFHYISCVIYFLVYSCCNPAIPLYYCTVAIH